MTPSSLRTDVAIIGGGIAGLWALNRLRRLGYSALLFEAGSIGGVQTMHAQGIIHSGAKYSLDGSGSAASAALQSMPRLWRACLSGDGPVDLRSCRVLSQHLYLCIGATGGTAGSGSASGAAERPGRPLDRAGYPPSLQRLAFAGEVRELDEPVVDISSLVDALAAPHRKAIFCIDGRGAALHLENGEARLELPGCSLRPQLLLLAAGAGNAALIECLGGRAPAMQRRPLQQVLVRLECGEPLFAHVPGNGTAPRMTITSHRRRDGVSVWYLGGDIAGDGAALAPAVLIERARGELRTLFPALPLDGSTWATARVDRAEVRHPDGAMPADAYLGPVAGADNVLVAWPTKLALCPRLGQKLEGALHARGITPRHHPDLSRLPRERPPHAAPCWETLLP